ncbi:MAG: transcriptional repressor, partial [Oscillospiraceae bacterium]|nr:transcriptional repressor [Oscillospiraceae bacterium]
MKFSRQRELILQTVQQSEEHLTAEQVYERLKPENTTLSLGTVYRNLNLLAEQGTLCRIPVPGGADVFDRNNDGHQHIICRCCGSVMDWRIPKMEELDQYLSELTGFAVDRHDFIAWGTCK